MHCFRSRAECLHSKRHKSIQLTATKTLMAYPFYTKQVIAYISNSSVLDMTLNCIHGARGLTLPRNTPILTYICPWRRSTAQHVMIHYFQIWHDDACGENFRWPCILYASCASFILEGFLPNFLFCFSPHWWWIRFIMGRLQDTQYSSFKTKKDTKLEDKRRRDKEKLEVTMANKHKVLISLTMLLLGGFLPSVGQCAHWSHLERLVWLQHFAFNTERAGSWGWSGTGPGSTRYVDRYPGYVLFVRTFFPTARGKQQLSSWRGWRHWLFDEMFSNHG